MRIFVEVRIDKSKQLPPGAASELAVELKKRLQRKFTDVEATVRMDWLSVRGGTTADRNLIEEVLQGTWRTADDWLQS